VRGLKASGVSAGIKASGNLDVGLLVADRPMSAAGVFTRNQFAAAPVLISRSHLQASGGLVRAVVVNSGNANACTGAQGETDALAMCRLVAEALACPLEQVLVCSTGVIGVKLNMEAVRRGIDAALSALSDEPEAGRRFLQSIMTTDAFPKEACGIAGPGIIAGVCKGAGMIQPNMATMLAFLATDCRLSPEQLGEALPGLAAASFNAVHVDSHTSTNDTLLLLSTGQVSAPRHLWGPMGAVARRLAWLIARDGEGATKVTTIQVTGARDDGAAKRIAQLVAHSALVRTALFGNDPNWGRITSQVGNSPDVANAALLTCTLQGVEVFRNGEPTQFDRKAVSEAMALEDVSIDLALSDGSGSAFVLTSDLGYRYVQVNAEYTT
jgi:glutamate N-acetyltransferase/amino-acid N-acetyltransferase